MYLEIIKKIQTKNTESILFVHGAYHAAWCWEKHFIDYFFNNGYNVYALSFRNHGRSEKIEYINLIKMNDLVSDLEQTVNKIPGKINIVAHSIGCRIVQLYLNEHLNRVAKLVLMSPMPIKHTFLQLFKIKIRQLGKPMEYILFYNRLSCKEYISLLESESKKVEYSLIHTVRLQKSIIEKIPCLVIGSFNDKCVTLQSVLSNADIYEGKVIIYPQMCHNMMLDPDWKNVADDILNFFSEKRY